jgi:predicted AlkP superfamily pyrophosphatase or phosphodiesterase
VSKILYNPRIFFRIFWQLKAYLLIGSCTQCFGQNTELPYIIWISFDGFRHDYVEKYNLPNFQKFIKDGVSAKSLIPSFPSKTFPNHYTLVTGMYPGSHGLVDNTFYDKKRNQIYRISNRDQVEDAYWYGGTPIWQLAQKQGIKTASYYWVGSEAPILGMYPNYYHKYNHSDPNEKRVDQVIDWLKLPEAERPHLITLYFSMVDETGHNFGPNSAEMRQTTLQADSLLGYLMKSLEQIPLPVNIVLTSDHGMQEIKKEAKNFIDIGEFTDLSDSTVHIAPNSFHVHIYCDNKDKLNVIYKDLKSKESNFKVYKKSDIPKKFSYNTHERIGDILVVTNPPFMIGLGNWVKNPPYRAIFGQHGSNPFNNKNLHGIFYARGKHFKKNHKIPSFQNIHVYPLIAYLMGLEIPTNIDGKLRVLKNILTD